MARFSYLLYPHPPQDTPNYNFDRVRCFRLGFPWNTEINDTEPEPYTHSFELLINRNHTTYSTILPRPVSDMCPLVYADAIQAAAGVMTGASLDVHLDVVKQYPPPALTLSIISHPAFRLDHCIVFATPTGLSPCPTRTVGESPPQPPCPDLSGSVTPEK